jgi:type I restriction enzyme R subunit
VKPQDLIASFRNSYNPRIAVTVDMIATGTDIKPLEVVFFMRSVRSLGFFEQMKGRGVRVLSETELQSVTPDARRKTHFVIVDAVGVCERDKGDSRPLERKRNVPFDKLLETIALGNREPAALESLAGRLLRLERLLDDRATRELQRLSGGPTLSAIARDILDALDPDAIDAAAKEGIPPGHEPTEAELQDAGRKLADDAVRILATKPDLRHWVVGFQRSTEQTIDTVSQDEVLEAGYSQAALDKARDLVASWERYIAENRDEIAAIQLLYTDARRLRWEQLKALADAIERPPRRWTPDVLWSAYERLGKTAAAAQPTLTGSKRILADLVGLVRVALHEQDALVPRVETVHRRFDAWLARQAALGRAFSAEQRTWLELIRDHIATSLAIAPGDFAYAPFAQAGGLGKAHQVFGNELPKLLEELNEVLAA